MRENMNAQELVLDDVYDVWFTPFWQTPWGMLYS